VTPDQEKRLTEELTRFVNDPYGFVMFAFRWGEGDLEGQEPDKWQVDILREVGETYDADPEAVIQLVRASGHGIGKTALVSWIILWAMTARPHLAGVVTANTMSQLTKKTWRELAVWHERMIHKHWFKWTATRFYHVDHAETWGVDAIPWTEHNSQSFAGLHSKYVLIIFDEASTIADKIWEVTEGAMTTPRAMWFAFGNPTENTGRFRECFGKSAHRWSGKKIDSRTCRMTNKAKLKEWEDDHGEDSDFFRVRVRGEFPRFGTKQLINSEAIEHARKNRLGVDEFIFMTPIIGVDVARFGQDETVVLVRQGRKVIKMTEYRGLNNVQVAARAAEEWRNQGGKGVLMVDEVGVGSGVIDVLQTQGYPAIGVNAGAKADNATKYYNKRAEMWHRMAEWFDLSVEIPDDSQLADQLGALEYSYDLKERIKLETKDELKERLPALGSPDRAEALALTFAQIIAPGNLGGSFEPEPEEEAF
jgi:hypothetical protein